jgi:hypothetical protein
MLSIITSTLGTSTAGQELLSKIISPTNPHKSPHDIQHLEMTFFKRKGFCRVDSWCNWRAKKKTPIFGGKTQKNMLRTPPARTATVTDNISPG